MSFNEKEFRTLVDETKKSVIALGTTSKAVLEKQELYAKKLISYLREKDSEFNLELCLDYVNSIEHEPHNPSSSSYISWIAFHRFVHLLDEQKKGTLSSWKIYLTYKPTVPQNKIFNEILLSFEKYLSTSKGMVKTTVSGMSSMVRKMLLFFENNGLQTFDNVTHSVISKYLISERFKGRKPKGIQAELYILKKFLIFAEENGYVKNKSLHSAILLRKINTMRIITTLTPQQEKDILEDEANSSINKRDIAITLLALHTGLRTCDIRSLKFSNINWEKRCISLKQRKTGVPVELPIDAETENAIIDYVLNERRECDTDTIFITAVGPIQEIKQRPYHIKYRAKGTVSENTIPHDGLHICRRTFASRLLNAGVALTTISEMLGQVSKNSVQCYLSTDQEKMKRCSLSVSIIPYEGGAYNV